MRSLTLCFLAPKHCINVVPTGEANFYFHWRGPESQHTWDWVLALKPGDRKVLPRMPMVAIHESVTKKVLLSPFRVTGATIKGVGHMYHGVGEGMCWIGDKVSMRKAENERWVAEADWVKAKQVEAEIKKKVSACHKGITGPEVGEKRGDFQIFNEKGEKAWKDSDDGASTVAESVMDEKIQKEFC
jgi:hypothetical protein